MGSWADTKHCVPGAQPLAQEELYTGLFFSLMCLRNFHGTTEERARLWKGENLN
jgi:hypothetical protein